MEQYREFFRHPHGNSRLDAIVRKEGTPFG